MRRLGLEAAYSAANLDILLDSDPTIRCQVMRDLINAAQEAIASERSRVAAEGSGVRGDTWLHVSEYRNGNSSWAVGRLMLLQFLAEVKS